MLSEYYICVNFLIFGLNFLAFGLVYTYTNTQEDIIMLHTVKAFKITWTNKAGELSFYDFTKRSAENSMERLSF